MLCDKYPPFVMLREREERFCIQMLCCGAHFFVCAALEGSHFKKERLSEGLLHSGALEQFGWGKKRLRRILPFLNRPAAKITFKSVHVMKKAVHHHQYIFFSTSNQASVSAFSTKGWGATSPFQKVENWFEADARQTTRHLSRQSRQQNLLKSQIERTISPQSALELHLLLISPPQHTKTYTSVYIYFCRTKRDRRKRLNICERRGWETRVFFTIMGFQSQKKTTKKKKGRLIAHRHPRYTITNISRCGSAAHGGVRPMHTASTPI